MLYWGEWSLPGYKLSVKASNSPTRDWSSWDTQLFNTILIQMRLKDFMISCHLKDPEMLGFCAGPVTKPYGLLPRSPLPCLFIFLSDPNKANIGLGQEELRHRRWRIILAVSLLPTPSVRKTLRPLRPGSWHNHGSRALQSPLPPYHAGFWSLLTRLLWLPAVHLSGLCCLPGHPALARGPVWCMVPLGISVSYHTRGPGHIGLQMDAQEFKTWLSFVVTSPPQ